MKCLNCDNDIEQVNGKRPKIYCNDACRMSYKRTGNTEQVISEQTISEHPIPNKPYAVIEGQIVYHRQAVSYAGDDFDTRPMPLADDDMPVPGNRCMYISKDNVKYIFDCVGKPFAKAEDWQHATALC